MGCGRWKTRGTLQSNRHGGISGWQVSRLWVGWRHSDCVEQTSKVTRRSPFKRHSGRVTSPSFSPVPGEYRFTSGSWDKIARIWTLNGELITCQGYSSLVVSLCFSPDGKHIASGSDVGKLPYEILGVDYWLFSYLKDTHLRSTQSVILPMKLWLSLDQLIEWSVFGIPPSATYLFTSKGHSYSVFIPVL